MGSHDRKNLDTKVLVQVWPQQWITLTGSSSLSILRDICFSPASGVKQYSLWQKETESVSIVLEVKIDLA